MAHILLIEDDSKLRSILAEILEDAGHRVSAASDGKEAEKCMAADPANLVLTDILMPEQEGIETIINLRRNYPKVKVIGMSGGGRGGAKHYLDAARTFGAQETLQKPFESVELLGKIDAVLNGTTTANSVKQE